MTSLTDAFQNLYTYIISIAGIMALVALIWAGILYLTSTGEPEKLAKAGKQVLATFFGIIILFGSYLILRTINPELVKFELPKLGPIVFHPLDKPAPETKVPTLLGKVEELAEEVKKDIEKLEETGRNLQNLVNECDCEETQPLCLCTGGDEKAKCQPEQCYAGPGFQPCPDEKEIKENQQRVVAWRDELFYYKNRAIAEEKDLHEEIIKVLNAKIAYFFEKSRLEEDQEVKKYFEEKKQEAIKEKNLKENLGVKLTELANLIEKLNSPAIELAKLPDECLINVKEKCQAHCKGECHDEKEGCQPDKCNGGNPCPTDDIQNQFSEIQNLKPQIEQVCDAILSIIEQIINLKTIHLVK